MHKHDGQIGENSPLLRNETSREYSQTVKFVSFTEMSTGSVF